MANIKQQPSVPSLDMSMHTLNTSSSKMKFSFPKTQRFGPSRRSACDSYYEIPSSITKRAPSFGYGNKDIGIRDDKNIPPPASYTLDSDFSETHRNRGKSFAFGREQMEAGGPLSNTINQRYIPGPGKYNDKTTVLLDRNHIPSLRSRLPDRSTVHLLKNPGPGSYQIQQLGNSNYYATSKYPNHTHFKISPGKRLAPLNKSYDIGPGQYNTIQSDINPQGRYVLSKNTDSKTRQFSKSPRQGLQIKHMLTTPGPKYALFSEFG